MLELTSNEKPVVLSPGTSVQLEYNSPLFDEEVVRGSFSYSFAVPAPPNGPLYGFPERLDVDATPAGPLPAALRLDGFPLLVGTQRVRTASTKKYNVNLTGALGGLATSLSERAIHSFEYGGARQMPPAQPLPGQPPAGLLQVPGWLLHANEVVRNAQAYDYVFAPVRTEDFYESAPAPVTPAPGAPSAPATPPVVLNPWIANTAPGNGYGLPAGGSFTNMGFKGYRRFLLSITLNNIFNPQSSQLYLSPQGEPIPLYGEFACPFPRLRYVLRAIFQEAGLRIDEPRFMPGELGDVVIFSPTDAMRTVRDATGVLQSGFYLADVLPDVTVAGLLQGARRGLGLVVLIDEDTRMVSTTLLRDIVAEPASSVPDLTHCLAGAAEVEIGEAPALQLVYEVDDDDELTKDLATQGPAADTLSPAVEQLTDLPATAIAGLPPETRLVRQEGAYYRSQSNWTVTGGTVNLTWLYVGPALDGVAVGGEGGEEYAQGFAYTAMGRAPFQIDPTNGLQLDPNATAFMEVPAVRRRGYEPANTAADATPRPKALRFLFWRGLQPASDGSLYPLVTPLATNQAGAAVGSLSLRLAGPAGTYEQLLRGWLEVKRRAVVVKQPLRLSVLDLARLDLARKVRFDGIEYLVRKLSVAVPLHKPATAELVRV